jgi:branched-chain amino acid transport system permease protein
MAVGLTLIFGVLDIINIAQGILVVLGAYLSYVLWTHLHIDVFVGLLITIPAMFILGVGIQYLFIRPLRGRERTSMSLLACYAVAIIIEGILYQIFGSNYVSINDYWTSPQAVQDLRHYLPYLPPRLRARGHLRGGDLPDAVPTQFGRSVRATMQDAARLIDRREPGGALTFGIGVGVTAAGGMVFGTLSTFNPNRVRPDLPRPLAIVILGGMGSIGGARGVVLVITLVAGGRVLEPQWSTVVFTGPSCSCSSSGRRACSGGRGGTVRSPAIWRAAWSCCWPSPGHPAGEERHGAHVGVFVLLYVGSAVA